MAKQKVHLIMVLDCSGSMMSVREEIVRGFNSALDEWKSLDKTKLFVTRLDFSVQGTSHVRVVCQRETPSKVGHFGLETYTPQGLTNMLDAVGQAISIGTDDTLSDSVVVVILSDGEENASSVHTYESIADLIGARSAMGNWTFAYVGANQDLSKVATQLNIPIANTMNYVSTANGTAGALASLTRSLGAHYASGATSTFTFFSEENVTAV